VNGYMSRYRNCLLNDKMSVIALDVFLGLHPAIFIEKVFLVA